MFSKFLNKTPGANPDATEIVETPEWRHLSQLEARVKQLEKRVTLLEAEVRTQMEEKERETDKKESLEEKRVEVPTGVATRDDAEHPAPSTTTLFLAAPDAEGIFTGCDTSEQIGKSMYRLTTRDGITGTFEMLDTPDALATALISVSQFVKTACRITGGIPPFPRQILTQEVGTAKCEGRVWRVVNKAIVSFSA